MKYPDWFVTWMADYPWLHALTAALLLLFFVWLSNFIAALVLIKGSSRVLAVTSFGRDSNVGLDKVIRRLANVVPAVVLFGGIVTVPHIPEGLVEVVRNVCIAYVVLSVALALGCLLQSINVIYNQRPDAKNRPIKGFLQVVQIVIYVVAAILMVAALIDRSPAILLSGLGAMAAVLLLVFQDTLLSLVASIQLSSNDMVRVGDWIEMPQLNADGDVIDIALHSVKVQNWDRTITTIPTKRLISDSFKNWRGMQESGGRRIKRALYIDQNSIHFISEPEREQLHRFALLDEYLQTKEKELLGWNEDLRKKGFHAVNCREMTNIGTFRAYVERYLRQHPGLNQSMTLIVRQLAPCAHGLPLEIYCFTNTTAWVAYEGIQSDIFDHLLAILPEFGLQIFQEPSGSDMRGVFVERALVEE